MESIQNFAKDKTAKLGLGAHCKACRRKKWAAQTKDQQRDSWYRHKYDLTAEQYNILLESQDYCCAICKTREPGGRNGRFNVDHTTIKLVKFEACCVVNVILDLGISMIHLVC